LKIFKNGKNLNSDLNKSSPKNWHENILGIFSLNTFWGGLDIKFKLLLPLHHIFCKEKGKAKVFAKKI
ncbi:hypothetical protein ACFFWB_27440, partial [Flavobacterium procerum]|uniref:hypothetical protein n=1 Tax=Flavobacterium procerum TaxID=1455569 RepID=UPI0035EC6467